MWTLPLPVVPIQEQEMSVQLVTSAPQGQQIRSVVNQGHIGKVSGILVCINLLLIFSEVTTKALCDDCPPGYYCLEGSDNYDTQVCPEGYYCPLSTRHAYEFPCPKGSYNPVNGSDALEDCLYCPPGQYCECEFIPSIRYTFSHYESSR